MGHSNRCSCQNRTEVAPVEPAEQVVVGGQMSEQQLVEELPVWGPPGRLVFHNR